MRNPKSETQESMSTKFENVKDGKEKNAKILLFQNRNIQKLQDYLDQNPDLNLMKLSDEQENSLLHQLAYENHLDIIKMYIQHMLRLLGRKKKHEKQLYESEEKQNITTWINSRNNQGFTPLLYAAYNGNMDIIKFLIEQYNASFSIETNTGLNVLHLAAQNNKVLPFLYFTKRSVINVDINKKDDNQSTPLHWASYMNSEQVVAFILSENLECLDTKDIQGQTPLMLSVMYGNTRIARRLLLKGADRYTKNNDHKTPLDIAKENQYKTISKMLNENFSACDFVKLYCNVKIQYRRKTRRCTIPIVFLVATLLNIGIVNSLIDFTVQYSWVAEAICFGMMMLLYLWLLGSRKPYEPRSYTQFMNEKEKSIKKLCFECKIKQPRRGYHCDVCEICIEQYDHHCTWINNCVGKHNLARFIFFLFFLIISLGFIGLISFLAVTSVFIENKELYKEWFTLRYKHQMAKDLEKYCTVAVLAISFITSLFVFPVLMLFIVQIKNLLKNKTTYETIRGPKEESPSLNKDLLRKNKNKVGLRNCKVMCSESTHSHSSFTSNSADSNSQLITEKELITEKYHSERVET